MPATRFPNRARFHSRTVALAAIVLLCAAVPVALAQDGEGYDPPAHVSFVDGTALIERDGKADNAPANMPLLAGDRIRTETGRVEILFADGSTLHLDNFTTVDFQSEEVVRVMDGRVRLTVAGRPRDLSYRLDAPHAWAHITQPGEYRLALMRRDGTVEVEFAVLRGSAELVNDDGKTPLRAGERAFARSGVAPSHAYVFNSAAWDAFDRWSETRRDDRLGLSSQYLPESVRPYARTFDTYGSWRHEPAYGYVWYPRVDVGWRPYYYGRWTTLRPYGWVWVGTDRWSWATHHYGRWGFSGGSWFWIPGRVWGPAWVSWAYAPGYVSWCPLGWDNRPLFSLVNINIYSPRRYDPWRAWTVVPRHHFGIDYVHRRVVRADVIDVRVRGAFAVRDSAPEITGYAVPRSTAPIRVVGRAVPRGGRTDSPIYTNRPANEQRDRSGASGEARAQRRAPGGVQGSPSIDNDSTGRRIQVDGANPAGVPDRDGRARAVPRSGDASGDARAQRRAPDGAPGAPASGEDTPRLVPDRGVRSAPVRRADAVEPSNDMRPQRAIPRGGAPRDDDASPSARPGEGNRERAYQRTPVAPREAGESPSIRHTPVTPREPGDAPSYRSRTPIAPREPGAEPGYRSRAPIVREPAHSPGPRQTDAPAYRPGPQRMPEASPRRETPSHDEPRMRPMPRREPDSAPRMEPPRIERREPSGPPPGARPAPRGGDAPRGADAPSRSAPERRPGGDGRARRRG